jgi:hypothetical protein
MEDIPNGVRDGQSAMNPITWNSTGLGRRNITVPNASSVRWSRIIDESYAGTRDSQTRSTHLTHGP